MIRRGICGRPVRLLAKIVTEESRSRMLRVATDESFERVQHSYRFVIVPIFVFIVVSVVSGRFLRQGPKLFEQLAVG